MSLKKKETKEIVEKKVEKVIEPNKKIIQKEQVKNLIIQMKFQK